MIPAYSTHDTVDQWFAEYFQAFIDIGTGTIQCESILRYWSVPFHTSSPRHSRWLNSAAEVVAALNDMQATLKQIGYTHTTALGKSIVIYNDNASRVEALMSRRSAEGTEIDRAAVSFELRRTNDGWIIISTTLWPTDALELGNAWS